MVAAGGLPQTIGMMSENNPETKSATPGKRAPLSDLSANVPAVTRQAGRVKDSESVENPTHDPPASAKIPVEKPKPLVGARELHNAMKTAMERDFPLVDSIEVLDYKEPASGVSDVAKSAEDATLVGNAEEAAGEAPPRRQKRARKPRSRSPSPKLSRKSWITQGKRKSNLTLGHHVKKYWSTHDIKM